MNSQSVQELMTSRPQVCTPQDAITDVARRMRDANIGSLPVVRDRGGMQLIGMVTDRDIVCRVVAAGRACGEATVAEAMSEGITAISGETTIDEAVRSMGDRQVRRLPVVDAQGRVVGILAQADLALAARDQGDLEDELAEVVVEVSEPSTASRA